MAKDPTVKLQGLASKNVLQVLLALLLLAMGITGFSSGDGIGSDLSREVSNMFGGDRELLTYIISGFELICGVFLAAKLFVKAIPAKLGKTATAVILVFWLALIVILDILTIDFGNFDGSDWIGWIETAVLHLIVLTSILQIQK